MEHARVHALVKKDGGGQLPNETSRNGVVVAYITTLGVRGRPRHTPPRFPRVDTMPVSLVLYKPCAVHCGVGWVVGDPGSGGPQHGFCP